MSARNGGSLARVSVLILKNLIKISKKGELAAQGKRAVGRDDLFGSPARREKP